MSTGDVKHELSAQFARIGKALSSANRLEIIEFLAQGERSVESLAAIAGLSVANTSQHLQQLRHAGLVTARKDGQRVFYRLTGTDVVGLLNALRGVAERHLAEVSHLVDTYLATKDELEPISADELVARMQSGEVTVLDVRPQEEYRAGHLPGAINVPVTKIHEHLNAMPQDRTIIAYCRGPYCVMSYDAVKMLRHNGLDARRLQEGFPEWELSGRPVDSSSK